MAVDRHICTVLIGLLFNVGCKDREDNGEIYAGMRDVLLYLVSAGSIEMAAAERLANNFPRAFN